MNCTQCGAALPNGARFCGQCGAPVVTAGGPEVAPPPGPAPAPAMPFAPPQGVPIGDIPADGVGVTEVPVVTGAPARGRRGLLLAGCVVVAVAVVGVVAWLLLRSDETAAGGAGSPEDVATGFAAAMSSEDLLAAAGYVSPLETPGLEQLLVTMRDAAKAQGIAGLSAGDGVDVELQMSADRVTEVADGIARVELRLDMSMTGSPSGPVGELLADTDVRFDDRDLADALNADALTMVVVEESGRWYVSPMLTIGEYAADALDVASPRYDQAVAPADERTATDEQGAVELLGDAIEERDAASAAGAFAPGEARFVRVFGRAIDDLLDRWEGDISFEKLDMSEVDDGRWAIDHLEVSAESTDGYGVTGVQVDGDCGMLARYFDIDEVCLRDLDWLTEPLDEDRLVLHTSRDGEVARIDLAATVIDDLGQLATRVTRPTLLGALDLELLDTPTPLTVDEPVSLTFEGEPYHVVEWVAAEDRAYLLEPGGDIGTEVEIFVDDEDEGWTWVDWTFDSGRVLLPQPAGTRFRAVVKADKDCDEICVPERGDAVLSVRRLQTIDAEVGTVVKPLLGPGVSVLLRIPGDDQHRYEVTTETEGVELHTVEYGSVYDFLPDDEGYLPGPYTGMLEILVTNRGDAEVRAEVALREHELAGGGGEVPSGEGVALDISSGTATYEFDAGDATSITVTAVPDSAQDIVLSVDPCAECFADSGYSGESEEITFAPDGESNFTVTVSGFSGVDSFGTVTVYIELS